MNYDEVVAVYFANPTPEGTVPEPTRRPSVARRLRDAIEAIAMHPVWSRTTNEAQAALGLDFFSGYAWGRAAALGEPAPAVVVSAFAVFEPGLIAGVVRRRPGRLRSGPVAGHPVFGHHRQPAGRARWGRRRCGGGGGAAPVGGPRSRCERPAPVRRAGGDSRSRMIRWRFCGAAPR